MIPKFRVWDSVEKKFVEHFFITDNGLICNMEKPTSDYNFPIPIEKSELILMQSTGLKDKNGKEIFEGDIVRTTRFLGRADEIGGFYEYEKDYVGVVEVLEGSWVIDTGSVAVRLWSEIDESEVLGNVYENPELLEDK